MPPLLPSITPFYALPCSNKYGYIMNTYSLSAPDIGVNINSKNKCVIKTQTLFYFIFIIDIHKCWNQCMAEGIYN